MAWLQLCECTGADVRQMLNFLQVCASPAVARRVIRHVGSRTHHPSISSRLALGLDDTCALLFRLSDVPQEQPPCQLRQVPGPTLHSCAHPAPTRSVCTLLPHCARRPLDFHLLRSVKTALDKAGKVPCEQPSPSSPISITDFFPHAPGLHPGRVRCGQQVLPRPGWPRC